MMLVMIESSCGGRIIHKAEITDPIAHRVSRLGNPKKNTAAEIMPVQSRTTQVILDNSSKPFFVSSISVCEIPRRVNTCSQYLGLINHPTTTFQVERRLSICQKRRSEISA